MLGAAARLGVADAPADEVRSADDLAKTCQADVDALYRLLRALASILGKEFPEAKIIILTALMVAKTGSSPPTLYISLQNLARCG